MAVGVLLLWMFTVAAGFYLLTTSNLRRGQPVPPPPAAAVEPAAQPAAQPAVVSVAQAAPATATAAPPISRRELKRANRDRFDPPSLIAARNAPVLPGARSLLEFAHPACAIIGLAFWLGFTLVHNRVLGWIAFGLVTLTACAGLTWFTTNVRAARTRATRARAPRAANPQADQNDPAPSFNGRLVVIHGGGAALTVVLAALSALILHG